MNQKLSVRSAALAAAALWVVSVSAPAAAQAPELTDAQLADRIAALQLEQSARRLTAARAALAAAEQEVQEAQARMPAATLVAAATPTAVPAATAPAVAGAEPPTSQPPKPAAGGDGTQPPPTPPAPPAAPPPKDPHSFGGIDFGIGLSFSYDLGGERRVRDAEVVNGLVRVTRADNARARMILESHYFFTPGGATLIGHRNYCTSGRVRAGRERYHLTREADGTVVPTTMAQIADNRRTYVSCTPQINWGVGPFVALQPGSDEVIDAVGAGLMMGFRRAGDRNQSFNFGIGMLYDLDVRVLGPGIVANQALPPGETTVRFQQREQASLLFLSSFSF